MPTQPPKEKYLWIAKTVGLGFYLPTYTWVLGYKSMEYSTGADVEDLVDIVLAIEHESGVLINGKRKLLGLCGTRETSTQRTTFLPMRIYTRIRISD